MTVVLGSQQLTFLHLFRLPVGFCQFSVEQFHFIPQQIILQLHVGHLILQQLLLCSIICSHMIIVTISCDVIIVYIIVVTMLYSYVHHKDASQIMKRKNVFYKITPNAAVVNHNYSQLSGCQDGVIISIPDHLWISDRFRNKLQ